MLDGSLRGARWVHTQLAALLVLGRPLAAAPDPVRGHLDDRLIEQVAAEYRALSPDGFIGGRAAIITAGVPGAGKSFALNAIAADYRRIDPDMIND